MPSLEELVNFAQNHPLETLGGLLISLGIFEFFSRYVTKRKIGDEEKGRDVKETTYYISEPFKTSAKTISSGIKKLKCLKKLLGIDKLLYASLVSGALTGALGYAIYKDIPTKNSIANGQDIRSLREFVRDYKKEDKKEIFDYGKLVFKEIERRGVESKNHEDLKNEFKYLEKISDNANVVEFNMVKEEFLRKASYYSSPKFFPIYFIFATGSGLASIYFFNKYMEKKVIGNNS